MDERLAFRDSLVVHLRETARWRRSRFDDDLRDSRNLRSAEGLEELAWYVSELSPDDARLVGLARYTALGTDFIPGQQVHYEIGRFRFHDQETTFDSFLTWLVELAEADHRERGQFGGPQVPGDNPWSAH